MSGGDIYKKPRTCIGLEIRTQSGFAAFRALLPSANYSAEWSGRVWQPTSDCNCHLAHFFNNLKRDKQPLYSQQRALIQNKSAPNCYYHLQRAVTPNWMGSIALWEHIRVFFSWSEKPSEEITRRLFLINMKGLSWVRTGGAAEKASWDLSNKGKIIGLEIMKKKVKIVEQRHFYYL